MRVTVVTPPDPVVSLDDAKLHLRVCTDDEDTLIAAMVTAATAHIDGPDGWLGRCIGRQTLEARGVFGLIRLPYPPIVSVENVTYDDAAGVNQTLLAASYQLRGVELALLATWPVTRGGAESVRVRYVAGYDVVPAPIRAAIFLMVGDLYSQRSSTVEGISSTAVPMSMTVDRLLAPYRVFA